MLRRCSCHKWGRVKVRQESRRPSLLFMLRYLFAYTDCTLPPSMSLSFQIWGIRFQLLMALKLYSQLVEELQPFGELDAPDLCYQYYSESNEKTGTSKKLLPSFLHWFKVTLGSLIPFSMRLIHAEVLRFTPFPWKAVERVKRLELDVNKVRGSFH